MTDFNVDNKLSEYMHELGRLARKSYSVLRVTNNNTKNYALKKMAEEIRKREKQILSLVLELKNNKDIADELAISKRTAEVHRFNLMKKLEAKNLQELTTKAKEYQLL